MNVGSLFTGIRGLDLGLEAAGFRTVWACESDEACRRVIERTAPGIPIVPDVREVDAGLPPVDVLAGGFPCPDFSVAGKRLMFEGERAQLWFEFSRAVRVLRPRHVVVENVPGLLAALGVVLADLAQAGYVGRWFCLRAADVGAPHRRERVFILAADASGADGRGESAVGVSTSQRGREAEAARGRGRGASADADGRRREQRDARQRGLSVAGEGGAPSAADASSAGREGAARGARGRAGSVERGEAPTDADGKSRLGEPEPSGVEGARGSLADGRDPLRQLVDSEAAAIDWGAYGLAVERWAGILGREAPQPTDDRGRLAPEFVEWMMGFPAGWTEGEKRTARLRMLGNAVQVQCAELVGAWLLADAAERATA